MDAEVFLDKRWMHNSFNSATPKENKITDSANQVQENKQRSKSLNREISQEKLLERDWGKQDESKKAPQNSKKEGSHLLVRHASAPHSWIFMSRFKIWRTELLLCCCSSYGRNSVDWHKVSAA